MGSIKPRLLLITFLIGLILFATTPVPSIWMGSFPLIRLNCSGLLTIFPLINFSINNWITTGFPVSNVYLCYIGSVKVWNNNTTFLLLLKIFVFFGKHRRDLLFLKNLGIDLEFCGHLERQKWHYVWTRLQKSVSFLPLKSLVSWSVQLFESDSNIEQFYYIITDTKMF